MIEVGHIFVLGLDHHYLVDAPANERSAYLASQIWQGKSLFITHYGLDPVEVSLPIIGLPAWRDLVELHRVGPWQLVKEFHGMKLAYNTECAADPRFENECPVIIFRASRRTEPPAGVSSVSFLNGGGS